MRIRLGFSTVLGAGLWKHNVTRVPDSPHGVR